MNLLMMELFPTDWSPMKTILNLIVCFLLVAQLISSSPLIVQKVNYKLSEYHTYSIIRISMDLYQMSKYENIADRLRRLASNGSNSANADTYQPQTFRGTQTGNVLKKEILTFQADKRQKYTDNLKYSKLSTNETDRNQDQQENSYINERIFPRENINSALSPRTKVAPFVRNIEFRNNPKDKESQEKPAPWRNDRNDATEKENKKSLAKVKSDGNIKFDEIMDSFNAYKQNKEKFVSTLGKTSAHNRTQTDNLGKYVRETTKHQQSKEKNPQEKKRLFKEIDNIWNEQANSDDGAPKFERSGKTFRGLDNFTDLLNDSVTPPETVIQYRPRDQSKSRQIFRNASKPSEQFGQKIAIKTLLSPRGARIPGKIIKNSKEFANFQ